MKERMQAKEAAGASNPTAAALCGAVWTVDAIDDLGMRQLFGMYSEMVPSRQQRPLAAKLQQLRESGTPLESIPLGEVLAHLSPPPETATPISSSSHGWTPMDEASGQPRQWTLAHALLDPASMLEPLPPKPFNLPAAAQSLLPREASMPVTISFEMAHRWKRFKRRHTVWPTGEHVEQRGRTVKRFASESSIGPPHTAPPALRDADTQPAFFSTPAQLMTAEHMIQAARSDNISLNDMLFELRVAVHDRARYELARFHRLDFRNQVLIRDGHWAYQCPPHKCAPEQHRPCSGARCMS